MANLVLGGVGAVVGGIIFPGVGASWGWMIGSAVGGMLGSGAKGTHTTQPLADLKVPGTDYGQVIPWLRGSWAMGGQVWWNSDKVPTYTTTSSGGGGKGSAPENTSTTITYSIDLLIGFTDNPIVGIGRIWDSGTLIREGIASTSIASEHWDRLTVYTGAENQLPDPDYEAAVGAPAPAYVGRGTCFIKGLKLGQSGQLRNLVFEVIVDGTYGGALREYFGANEGTGSNSLACVYDSINDVVLFGAASLVPNETGGTGRIEVFDCSTKSFLTPLAVRTDAAWDEDPQVDVLSLAMYTHVAYDKLYVPISVPSEIFTFRTAVYDLSTREFLRIFNFTSNIDPLSLPFFIEGGIVAIDSANNYAYVSSGSSEFGGVGYAVKLGNDGIPDELSPVTTLSPGVVINHRSHGIVDANGDCWVMPYLAGSDFCRAFIGSDGLDKELHSTGADSYNPYPRAFTYDDSRDRIYYFSENMQWLKYFDCATRTTARINASAFTTMGDTPNSNSANASITYDAANDRILLVKGTGDTVTLTIVDPDTGSIVSTTSGTSTAEYGSTQRLTSQIAYSPIQDAVYGLTWRGGGSYQAGIGEFGFGTTPGTITVAAAQAAICERAGLSASQYDVSQLASITRSVRCLPWAEVSGAAEPTERLMSAYFYDCAVSGLKLVFKPRGGSSVATIEYDELGAAEGQSDGSGLPLRNVSDLENPAIVAVSAINVDGDYQTATEQSDRLVTHTNVTVDPISIALGLTPSEIKTVAEVIARDRALSVWSAQISTQGDRCALEPMDVVTIEGPDGSSYRMRIIKRTDSFPLLRWEVVLDSASVLSSQGITSADYSSETQINPTSRTEARLLDISILRDEDDDNGYYAAMHAYGTNWPGWELHRSNNNVTYALLYQGTDRTVMGTTQEGSTLGDWTGPRVIDEINSVIVSVFPGELQSSTRDVVLNDSSVNTILIGNEILQFITATLVSEGVYRLSRLLRGCRGTEWAMIDHEARERVVLLRAYGLRRIVPTNSELGVVKYYKAVTRGRPLSSTAPFEFAPSAQGKIPFSCFDLRATRDSSNNITFTWQRRSRLEVRMIGELGINVPADSEETYELDIYEDTSDGGDVVRTISASTTSATYSAANQTSDGLSPGDYVIAKLYPISGDGRRGRVYEGVV